MAKRGTPCPGTGFAEVAGASCREAAPPSKACVSEADLAVQGRLSQGQSSFAKEHCSENCFSCTSPCHEKLSGLKELNQELNLMLQKAMLCGSL